jgi:ribosomal protein S18 acetylase RimI-like enzyme
MDLKIRLTKPEDVHLLLVVERSAGESFRIFPDLAWIADDDGMPAETHLKYVAQGTSWVAEVDNQIVGFICAEASEEDFHIWELSVQHEQQGRGIGRRLMKTALADARRKGFRSVTLTTFREVPWNEPFYRSLGFELIDEENMEPRLKQILLAEIGHGLPGARRCAMKLLISA